MKNQLPIWYDARVFVINGAGAAEFLQGYLTCDTRRLEHSSVLPMAICNVKGRVLANGWALALSDGVGLLIHASLLESVAAFLKPYITFSKCSADPALAQLVSVSNTPSEHCLGEQHFLHLLDLSVSNDTANTDTRDISATVNQWLIEQGFAFISAPVSAQFLPQMLNLDQLGAVDFDKGCYLGQEIVARAQFRGAVKRHLQKFSWQNQQPTLGKKLGDNGVVVAYAHSKTQDDVGDGLAITKD